MKTTRASLVQDLMAQGFSRRRAVTLLKCVMSAIIHKLKEHEPVELPFGTLEVKRNPPPVRFFTHGTIAERFSSSYRVVLKPKRLSYERDEMC